jgi:tetratricopeptide (TPR) repeat protein
LDAHPLVREYFGEQLRTRRTDAWKESNTRLYNYYRGLAPQLPDNFREMEPLLLAVICGCNAGLFQEALHEVYIPRIQRGKDSFAANVLGARGALLSVLACFFEHGRWGSLVEAGVKGQILNAEDHLFILMQAGLYLTATRGLGSPDAGICYERAEALCHSLNRPMLLHSALMGQWRYSLMTNKLTATMQIAERVYSLTQEQNDSSLIVACSALATTLYFLGDFETARQYAMRGIQIWRSGSVQAHWRAVGVIYGGWARSASGDTAAGVAWIEDGIRDWRATGAVRLMPVWLSLKAEALYLTGRTPEALEAIKKAVALSEGSGEREWYPELQRLRGVFLAAIGAEATQIEASFSEAVRIAREQKSVSLEKRAEATVAEYRRQKAGGSGERGFRLPLS